MRRLDNIINIRTNYNDIYEKLVEHPCKIYNDKECIYEGLYNKEIGIKIENPEQSLIVFEVDGSSIVMTISENKSLNEFISIFEESQQSYDEVMTNPKLYNKIINLSIDFPKFPSLIEGNNIKNAYYFLCEDDSIPGDGLPDEDEKKKKKDLKRRGEIQFTIWEEPDKKVPWIESNTGYQKIQYTYENKKKGLSIDFLLGYQDGNWKLWTGKPGGASYDDDPYCNLKEHKFDKAIIAALDKVEEIIDNVEENPDEWPQFYINI